MQGTSKKEYLVKKWDMKYNRQRFRLYKRLEMPYSKITRRGLWIGMMLTMLSMTEQ